VIQRQKARSQRAVSLPACQACTPALTRLEAITHPLITASRERFLADAQARDAPVVVVDVPLLFETAAQSRCYAVAVVSALPKCDSSAPWNVPA